MSRPAIITVLAALALLALPAGAQAGTAAECDSTQMLLDLLDCPDPAIRTAGLAGYWASLENPAEGIDTYLRMLDDPDGHVWQMAFGFSMKNLQNDDLRYLQLLEVPDPDYRSYAVRNMPMLLWTDAAASQRIISMLDDPDPRVAGEVAKLLFLMGQGAAPAVPRLFELATQPDLSNSYEFVEALAKMPRLSLPHVRQYLESATVADNEFQVMLQVAEQTGAEGAELAPLLRDLVRSSDIHIGFTLASSALGAVSADDPRLISEILALAEQTTDVPRSAALDALGYIGPLVGENAEKLWVHTQDSSKPVRVSALEALESIGYGLDGHIDELVALARDPDVGKTALRMLGTMPTAARQQLLELYETSDDETRLDVFRTLFLGDADPDLLVELLLPLLDSQDPMIVYEASRLMQFLGPPAAPAVPRLIELLGSGNDSQVEMAIFALARIGPEAEDAVPALTELAEHAVHGDKARWAIVRITDPENAGYLP